MRKKLCNPVTAETFHKKNYIDEISENINCLQLKFKIMSVFKINHYIYTFSAGTSFFHVNASENAEL